MVELKYMKTKRVGKRTHRPVRRLVGFGDGELVVELAGGVFEEKFHFLHTERLPEIGDSVLKPLELWRHRPRLHG
jgi:hypothetical protein